MAEGFSKWRPIDDLLETPCAALEVHGVHRCSENLTLLLKFSDVVDNPAKDLRIEFEYAPAYMCFDESIHPWSDENIIGLPLCAAYKWGRHCWPLLEVHQSKWLASFSDSRLAPFSHQDHRHYRIVTLDQTADILSRGSVRAGWIDVMPPQWRTHPEQRAR